MKKNIIEVHFNNKLSENDVLVYRGGMWVAINKSIFLDEVKKNLSNLNTKIESETTNRINDIRDLVEEIHNLKIVISYILGDDYENVLKDLESEEIVEDESEDVSNENEESN